MLYVFGLLLHEGIVGDVSLGFSGNVLHGNESMAHGMLEIEFHIE